MMACSAASPSVTGPGCKISGDLISCSSPSCTAGIRSKPGRCATFSGRNFLPHHESMMTSGARRITSSAVTTRSLASLQELRSAKTSVPPAAATSSDTQARDDSERRACVSPWRPVPDGADRVGARHEAYRDKLRRGMGPKLANHGFPMQGAVFTDDASSGAAKCLLAASHRP
jgi:hypothetical protein